MLVVGPRVETQPGRTVRTLPRVLGSCSQCSDYLHFVFTEPGPRAGKWAKLVHSFNKRLGTGQEDGQQRQQVEFVTRQNLSPNPQSIPSPKSKLR